MQESWFTVTENAPLNRRFTRLRLRGDTAAITAPGQFLNLQLEGLFLRRPLSVCDVEGDTVTVIYEAVGRGTEQLRRVPAGSRLNALTGLGNGFDLDCAGERPLLLGGGTGVSPLYWLARELLARGRETAVILGFPTGADVFYEEEFRALGASVTVVTEDGSRGVKGYVTDAITRPYSYFYACGPDPMLKALCQGTETEGQLSFATRMGCGFGACMGCSRKTRAGSKRICKDGPVLRKGEILWED